MPSTHRQVTAIMPGEGPILVDEGMKDVLELLWRHGYRTNSSCQQNGYGDAFIQFEGPLPHG